MTIKYLTGLLWLYKSLPVSYGYGKPDRPHYNWFVLNFKLTPLNYRESEGNVVWDGALPKSQRGLLRGV